jgi:hypothetical protein
MILPPLNNRIPLLRGDSLPQKLTQIVLQRFPRTALGSRADHPEAQHPVVIASKGVWKQKMQYLHDNPCRKGLVLAPEEWRFSSALYWETKQEDDVQLSIEVVKVRVHFSLPHSGFITNKTPAGLYRPSGIRSHNFEIIFRPLRVCGRSR